METITIPDYILSAFAVILLILLFVLLQLASKKRLNDQIQSSLEKNNQSNRYEITIKTVAGYFLAGAIFTLFLTVPILCYEYRQNGYFPSDTIIFAFILATIMGLIAVPLGLSARIETKNRFRDL